MKKILTLFLAMIFFGIGNAQVSFTPAPISTNGAERAVVDMNGDFLDDVVSVTATNIQIYLQQPNGSFIEENITTSPADNTPSWSLSAADYDKNGTIDLLYAGGNGVTFMRANNSNRYDEVS